MARKVEFSSKLPSVEGFALVKWRWVNERSLGWSNFFRQHSKDYKKTVQGAEAWMLWLIAKLLLTVWGDN
ncbi:MAG TPA: hypothetical protein PKC76_05505 [Saprospiraceae bacterium]|nr:hypothetical protein [Saprospiraceae bacterium]HMP23565.1 hypothetical protein [Saprospiraceae bacterium]